MLAALDRSCRVDAKSDAACQLRPQLGLEHAERVRPELVDRGAEARLVAEACGPQLGVQAVVDLLAIDLRGEARKLRVVRGTQGAEPQAVRFLVEVAARDRVRPVEQVQLD